MTHEFEVREEITLAATPEEVWQAIATGPGIDSWLFGHTEVEPREGGRTSMTIAGQAQESTITAWEPGRRFAYRGDTNPDGSFMAFEYLIEGREGGSTVLRFVHNGFLGDDWEAEYEGLRVGDRMYLEKLAVYLSHFPGRTARAGLFLVGSPIADSPLLWEKFAHVCGVTGEAAVGDGARLDPNPHALKPIDGVVEIATHPHFLGVRTRDGLYTLIHGYQDMVVVEYNDFGGADIGAIEGAWESWLGGLTA